MSICVKSLSSIITVEFWFLEVPNIQRHLLSQKQDTWQLVHSVPLRCPRKKCQTRSLPSGYVGYGRISTQELPRSCRANFQIAALRSKTGARNRYEAKLLLFGKSGFVIFLSFHLLRCL